MKKSVRKPRSAPRRTAAVVSQSVPAATASAARLLAQLHEDLAVEAFALLRLRLLQFGMTAAHVRRALDRSWTLSEAPAVSGPLFRDIMALSALLLKWSRDPAYLDEYGTPRLLPIKGPGKSFERLAREFLPSLPLSEVIRLASATSEVALRPGAKIALLGGVMVNVAKTSARPLALAVRHLDQILGAILHNTKLAERDRGKARMHRIAVEVIPKQSRRAVMDGLRPQIDDLFGRVDSTFERHKATTSRSLKGASAVTVSIYVSQEDDLIRAGVDSLAPTPRRKRR